MSKKSSTFVAVFAAREAETIIYERIFRDRRTNIADVKDRF